MGVRVLHLRYPGTCVKCGRALSQGTQASWDDVAKTVACQACPKNTLPPDPFAGPQVTESAAGESAQREYARRRSNHERQVRVQHPVLGKMILATTSEPSIDAWAKGAKGERSLGDRLDALSNVWVLHDRLIPGSKANIDHLVVSPTGIWVVDAKRYKGRIERRSQEPLGLGSGRLFVGSRDRTNLIAGVQRQVGVVHAPVPDRVPVHGALCFVDGDWSLFSSPFTVDGVAVHWPKSLSKSLEAQGPITRSERGEMAELLDCQFRPAVRS